MENNNQYFTYISQILIMVADTGVRDYDLRKEIEILVKHLSSFSVIVLNMMKLLAKTSKTKMKESCSGR